MNKTYAVLLLSAALSVIASATPASATSSFTTYQMEFREVTANEAQGVIDRAIGSGTVDIGTGEQLLKSARTTTHGASQKWLNDHPDAKIVGGVPFYGTRNLPVAYEYFIACGDKICGEFYEVFPNATGMDDAVRMFRRGAKCLAAWDCSPLGSNTLSATALNVFFIPNAVPASIRLAETVPSGRIQFYHGIYAIAERGRKVVSLDPRDEGLTRAELKHRLLGLIDMSLDSPSIPLVLARARHRDVYPSTDALSESGAALQASRNSERAYECQKIGLTTSRTIRISNGDGTFHDEIVYDAHRPTGSLYAPNCVGLSLSVPLMIGHYSLLDGFDYLTGRVGSGLYDTKSYLDTPGI